MTDTLALAEGFETATMFTQHNGIPCWATLGAARLDGVHIPNSVRTLIIAEDNDPEGRRARRKAWELPSAWLGAPANAAPETVRRLGRRQSPSIEARGTGLVSYVVQPQSQETPMNDLFDAARDRASCCTAAAMRLVPSLKGQDKITRALLNEAMTTAFGGSDADGRWTQRESFEVLKLALALVMRSRSTDREHVAHDDVLQAAVLLDRLPTQTVRSKEHIEWQQFSTPLDLAAVALMLAAPIPSDIVLEPSAGNDLLVAQLPVVAALQLNEIDPARRARLQAVFQERQSRLMTAQPSEARWQRRHARP